MFVGIHLRNFSNRTFSLSMMAPRIVDPQNAIVIYDVLTFDSEKSKVGENHIATSLPPRYPYALSSLI